MNDKTIIYLSAAVVCLSSFLVLGLGRGTTRPVGSGTVVEAGFKFGSDDNVVFAKQKLLLCFVQKPFHFHLFWKRLPNEMLLLRATTIIGRKNVQS